MKKRVTRIVRPRLVFLALALVAAGLLWGLIGQSGSPPAESPDARQPAPDLLLITVDTFRADRTSLYGRAEDTTPVLRALASTGVSFDHALSTAPWTLPSLASIHSGRLPSVHGAIQAESKLPESIETVAEVLAGAGYQTRGAVTHLFAGAQHGLAQGFESFDESQDLGHDAVTSEALTSIALELAGRADPARPLFLWVHYFDPHFSYLRHRGFGPEAGVDAHWPRSITAPDLNAQLEACRERGEEFPAAWLREVEEVYDQELAYTDRWIGELLSSWRNGRSNRSAVVAVTGDHGEYFLDRGRFFHGQDVYDALVHVPLVIAGDLPETWGGRRVSHVVSLVDLGRSLLRRLGLESESFPGRDLFAPPSSAAAVPVYVEGNYAWGTDRRKTGVVLDGFKLVRHLDLPRYELYDLRKDPRELHDLWAAAVDTLAGKHPRRDLARRLRQLALDYPPETRSEVEPSPVEISQEQRDKLRSLGYTP